MADEPLEPGDELPPATEANEGEQETDRETVTPVAAEGAEPAADEPKKEPWFTKRIGVLTAEKQAERQRAEQLQRENEALRALVNKPAEGATPEAEKAPAQPAPPDDFHLAVASAAAAQVALQRFNEQCDAVAQKGATLFPGEFDQAVANLNAAGVIRPDDRTFLEAALATESPEQVIFRLGNEPEEAMRLASLPPTQLAVALDRMARDLTKAPERTSDAPTPLTPVNSTRTTKPFDAADSSVPYATWIRERNKQVEARKANR